MSSDHVMGGESRWNSQVENLTFKPVSFIAQAAFFIMLIGLKNILNTKGVQEQYCEIASFFNCEVF